MEQSTRSERTARRSRGAGAAAVPASRFESPGLELRSQYEFEGVTLRVFPLRASLNRLGLFCDRYFNIAPEHARFRPAMPWVFFIAVNYGRMTTSTANRGWVAQNEIAFCVPLEWSTRAGDGWRFHDWAVANPFIFVDEQLSLMTGREVYGWPKIMAHLTPEENAWMNDPRSPRKLLRLRTLMFSELYRGRKLEPTTLLEVDQEISQSLLQFPANARYLLNPLLNLPGVAAGSVSTVRDLGRTLRTLMSGSSDGAVASLRGLLSKLLQPWRPRPHSNLVNLKQFRSSESPFHACYQALVNARLEFAEHVASGPLGDLELLRGDPTGGFRVRVHRHPAYPIVDLLGLDVAEEVRDPQAAVATLKPVYPFWVTADISLSKGRKICFRAEGSDWCTAVAAEPAPFRRPSLYLNELGPMTPVLPGPFEFSDVVLRVLPLVADSDVLMEGLRSFFSLPEVGVRPRDFGLAEGKTLVFLIVTTYGGMSSEANDVGWWANRELTFALPLVVKLPSGLDTQGLWRDHNFLFLAYVFSDSPFAVTTGREATGLPITYGRLTHGADPWIDDASRFDQPEGQGVDRRCVLSLATRIFPAHDVGAKVEERVLLELDRVAACPRCRPSDEPWVEKLKYRTVEVAEELCDRTVAVHNFAWKAYRDAEDPGVSCYEAITSNEIRARRPDIRPEVTGDYEVRIFRYPDYSIVDDLGLEVAGEEIRDGVKMQRLRAVAPFQVKTDLVYRLGKKIVWRLRGDAPWSGAGDGTNYLETLLATALESNRKNES